jgi:hypothetical protein
MSGLPLFSVSPSDLAGGGPVDGRQLAQVMLNCALNPNGFVPIRGQQCTVADSLELMTWQSGPEPLQETGLARQARSCGPLRKLGAEDNKCVLSPGFNRAVCDLALGFPTTLDNQPGI